MSKTQFAVVVCSVVLSFSSAFAGPAQGAPVTKPGQQVASGDAALVQAGAAQKQVNFLTAKGLIVSELLKPDTQGNPHQKFNVRLSDGRVVMIVSNLDMCENVPVQVGDVVSAGGQFIPTGHASGLLHWTHKDPRKQRPDGFIELKGHVYCQ